MRKIIIIICFILLITSFSFAYSDVSEAFWAYPAITLLTENKILTGYPDGTFRANENMSTAEFITVLTKILNLNNIEGDSSKHWADKYIEELKIKKILNLDEYESFNPDEKITRREICKMIVNSFDATKNIKYKDNITCFNDISPENIQDQRITRVLKDAGILKGYPDGTVRLKNTATRAEVSSFIYLLKNKMGEMKDFTANYNIKYESNTAVADIGDKDIKLKKYRYDTKDIEYCTTIVKKTDFFEFDNALNTQYADVFKEIYNSKEPYFEYRKKIGTGNYVMAIEFTTQNNTDKYDVFAGYEFLHIYFPEEEINILSAFDTDEISRQKNNNGAVGEIVKSSESHDTSAFYILDKLPENKVELDRAITTLRDSINNKLVKTDSFHSIIINLQEV